jgi:CDP-glucose 4,6-dehydratase
MESMVDQLRFLQEAYGGKKVFLTGHTGFKGGWMLAWLCRLGATVKGYSLAPESVDGIFSTLPSNLQYESVIADIRDRQRLTDEILSFQPDYIFHLAAQPLVRYSYTHPAETFDVNVTGTANLLEAATSITGKCSIVAITTDKVYHNYEWIYPYRENDRLGGYDPYSASKACAELVIDSFRNSFFNYKNYSTHQTVLASARAGNVIGGGDWSTDRIIPDIVRSLSSGNVIDVRNPYAVRPWQHVLEPVEGYLRLGALLNKNPEQFAKAYNFGPSDNHQITVKQVVELAIKSWGLGEWNDISNNAAPHEAGLLALDISSAAKELNWQPKLSHSEAIRWTIDWYKQYHESKTSIIENQIAAYEQLLSTN